MPGVSAIQSGYQRVDLICASADGPPDGAAAGPARARVLSCTAEPAWLLVSASQEPRLTRARPGEAEAAVLLEPVLQGRQARLLQTTMGDQPAYVNGLRAPRFVVLRECDCLRLEERYLFHVTVFHTPSIAPVSAAWIGRECPVCRVPFAAGAKCYTCACGTVMHCEDPSVEDSLQCARLCVRSGCPACQRPVVLQAGYSYLPEGIE